MAGKRNLIRLDVIQTALYRIADHDKKLDKKKLDEIKNKILQQDFLFHFKLKKFPNSRDRKLIAFNVVNPLMDRFIYYVSAERDGVEIHKIEVYQGITDLYYYSMFFQTGKWKDENTLILPGKKNEVETHVKFDQQRAQHINLTQHPHPPMFQMMRANVDKKEKDLALKNWFQSLPPNIASIITDEPKLDL